MIFLGINVMIHDVIVIANPYTYTAKLLFVDVRSHKYQQI